MSTVLRKENTKLGLIGLGLMGSRFLRRLNADGWNIRGWNRSKQATGPLTEYGFQIEPTLAGLVIGSEVIFSSLADDRAVEDVYLAPDGVFAHVGQGTIILETSTISPRLSIILHREAAKRGAHMIDLAVSGSTPAVETGAVTLFAGGEPEIFNRCIPIFESIARRWFLMGPPAAGIRMKLVVNLLLGVEMEAIAEAVSLGEHLDLDRDLLLEVLPQSAVVAPAFSGKFPKIRTRDYSPQFPLRLMTKDLSLAGDAAVQSGVDLPLGRATKDVFENALAENGDLDVSSIAAYVSGLAKRELQTR